MPKKYQLPEPDLITAIQNRTRIGAAALYDMYAANLYRVIYKIIRDDEASQDVLQQVLMKIWDTFDQFNPAKGKLYSWLVTIAKNAALTMVRSKAYMKQRRNDDLAGVYADVDREYAVMLNIDQIGVKSYLDLLKEEQRTLLVLLYFEGYTHVEAATYLGIPLGTVKTRWKLAIKALRLLLQVQAAA